ncbi:MAG: hypothetical protein BWZ07_03289 [Alphaproteobacteria bacterium ADurb.BinA280]|nr:MAG: hypothetical protein BWZ07_03289 [Alphaproteobacteria bacterium ADurb.BinA280]
MVPGVERKRRQLWLVSQGFSGNANICLAFKQQRQRLCRTALMQGQMDFREGFTELRYHSWQRVARLRMCGGNGELAFIAIGVLRCEMLDVLRIQQQTLHDCHQLATGIRQPGETLALAHEKLDAELVFEILDVLADTRL